MPRSNNLRLKFLFWTRFKNLDFTSILSKKMDIFYDLWWLGTIIMGRGASKAFMVYVLMYFFGFGLLLKDMLLEWMESCRWLILESLKCYS